MHHQTYTFHSTRCQQIPREASLRNGPKWFKSCSGNDQTWATWAPPKPVSPGSWEPTPRVCTKAQWRHELRAAVDSVPHRCRLHKPSARPPYLPTYGGDWHSPGAAAEAVRSPERRGGTEKRRAREPTPRFGRKGPAGVRAARLGDTRARGVRPLRALPGRRATAPRRRTGRRPATTRGAGSPPARSPPGARPPRQLLTLRLLQAARLPPHRVPAPRAAAAAAPRERTAGGAAPASRALSLAAAERPGRARALPRRPPQPQPRPPRHRNCRSLGCSLRSAPAPPHAPTPGSARRRPGSFSFCFQNKLYWSLFPLTSCKQTTNSSPPPRSPPSWGRGGWELRRSRTCNAPEIDPPGTGSGGRRGRATGNFGNSDSLRLRPALPPRVAVRLSAAVAGAVVSSWDSGRVTPVS